MTVFRKFEVRASYEHLWYKTPPSPSRKPLQASLKDDTTTINKTPKPSTFDILTRLFALPNSVDNFAVTRHRPADQIGDTQADPRKN
jgi:hypothetical protein